MGGNSGGIIVRSRAVEVLNDPTVHGQLPATVTGSLDPILAKDPSTWNHHECDLVGKAYHWALCNLH
jgi:hypothetical protein